MSLVLWRVLDGIKEVLEADETCVVYRQVMVGILRGYLEEIGRWERLGGESLGLVWIEGLSGDGRVGWNRRGMDVKDGGGSMGDIPALRDSSRGWLAWGERSKGWG